MAIGADAAELYVVSQYCVAATICSLCIQVFKPGNKHVVDPTASIASNVVMRAGIAIKSFQFTPGLNFFDNTAFRQEFQVTVNRSQADAGQSLPDPIVQFAGSGMRRNFSEFVHKNLPLIREPYSFIKFLHFSPSLIWFTRK